MANHFTSSFLDEIFHLCFLKKSFLGVAKEHLKYQFIPKELICYKYILQSIIAQHELGGKLPSYGVTSQQYASNPDVQNALTKIKNSEIIDQEVALKQLFEFIRDVKIQLVLEEAVNNYNSDKKEEAIKVFLEGAEDLANFSLRKDSNQFLRVFNDFHQQMRDRQISQETGNSIKEKVPFGIDILDIITDGGMDTGDIALWIMQSGKGKSTVLKWTGMYACRLGFNVLHIQLEGSKKEAFDKYTQVWTAASYSDVRWGNIPKDKMIKIDKVLDDMLSKGREVEIFSFEKYGSASMRDVRDVVSEYIKIKGFVPDLLIIDSLDLLVSGDHKKIDFDPAYKKDRLQSVAQRMKDMAVEFNLKILTATQTSDIPKEKYNNPDWVITRENTEGDRTLVKPFSHVFTGNQTVDEKKKKLFRINVDKLRYYDTKDQVYPIYTSFDTGRFYDKQKSIKEFVDLYDRK